MRCTPLIIAALLSGALSTPVVAQDDEGGLSVFALFGTQNKPTGFDVARTVSYGQGFHAGGGLVLGLYRNLAVRGDVAYAWSSGDETGFVTESVDLNRLYTGGSLELRLPLESGLTPYIFGGGGIVRLRRRAPTYEFDVSEGAGMLGAGARYNLRGSRLSAFAQVSEWVYPRSSADENAQMDTVLSLGVALRVVGDNR
jgi:hypothetical protein